jgi:putative transposase
MERIFRCFKTEWMPSAGYQYFEKARPDVSGYYSSNRPYTFNGGLTPIKVDAEYQMAS